MKYHFPEKVLRVRASLIREVAEKGSAVPGFITLALGNPASESIPVEVLGECMREVFDENPMAILQYGPQTGEPALLDWVRDRVVNSKGAAAKGNKPLLLTGSGKGLALAPRTICTENDEVFCDAFTFPNSFNCIKGVGAIPVGIPMDDDGMIPEALEEKARDGRGTYIYLIPNFHNPTGKTMPFARRKAIYEIARKYDLLIYEDDPYGDVRFRGESLPTLKSMDDDGRVIYAGSFSKTLSAGLRVGYLYAADELINKMSTVKNADGQDALLNQKIISKCLGKIDFDEHLKKISEVYGRKAVLMMDAIHEFCSPELKLIEPDGGMFIWVEIPEHVDIDAMSDAAIAAGVGVVKSEAFAVNPGEKGHAFRLNFSALRDEDITEGIRRFGKITREYLG